MHQRSSYALAVGVFALLIGCGASSAQQVDYTTAEFTVPADPTRAVLHVTATDMDMSVRSLTLYGDGRIELSDNRTGEYEGQIEFAEVERVLSDAVSRGLAEWDPMAIHSQQLTATEGKGFAPRADATRVLILIGVDDYRRGDYEVDRVERRISMSDPYFLAEHFPQIPQFQGILEVFKWSIGQLEAAKSEDGE